MSNSITISSSIKFKEQIKQVSNKLKELSIDSKFPNLDIGVKKEDIDLALMKQLESDHFRSIDDSSILYVICPEGYIGSMVSVEIGYASAKGKIIVFSERPADIGLQALANEYISMDHLDNFIKLI